MRPIAMFGAVVAATLGLTACADDYGYGHSHHYGYNAYPAYGWYDGFYGPVYDGYWGDGGYYYNRIQRSDRWHRDDGRHFRGGTVQPAQGYFRYDRAAPPREGRQRGDHGRGNGRGHDRDD